MNKQFALDYNLQKGIYDGYHSAKDAGDENGMAKFKEQNKVFLQYMEQKEKDFLLVYGLYKSAQERGNEYIDLSEPHQYSSVDTLLEALRKYEVEKFTFSAGWSSAIEISWKFIKSGCTLEGMVEINGTTTEIWSEKYERVPAYIFKVN